MEPGDSMPHLRGLSNKPYPESNHQIPRIDTYFNGVHSNYIILHKCLMHF